MSTLNTFPFDTPSEDSVYRVKVHNDINGINVVCIGMDCIDSPISDGYYCYEDIPEWMTNRLAVLGICTYGTTKYTWLEGVGARINADTYWVLPRKVGVTPTI